MGGGNLRKSGKELEQIVALLEKQLDNSVEIELNKFLDDLENPPHKRECDIVITERNRKRETVTIVEVQDRNSKVTIGDFSNFLMKKDAVGANRLIVVSRQPFHDSVVHKAMRKGPSVDLINVNSINEDNFNTGSIISHLHIEDKQVIVANDGHNFTPEQKKLIESDFSKKVNNIKWNNRYCSLEDIIQLESNAYTLMPNGKYCIDWFGKAENGLKLRVNGTEYPAYVGIKAELIVERHYIQNVSEYRPHSSEPLIFFSTGQIEIDGKSETVLITYEWINKIGRYKVASVKLEDSEMGLSYFGSINVNRIVN